MMLLKELLQKSRINCIYDGNDELQFDGLNLCNRDSLKTSLVSYAVDSNYLNCVSERNNIRALFVKKGNDCYNSLIKSRGGALIYCDDPEMSFYNFHDFLLKNGYYDQKSFKPIVGKNCNIATSAVINKGVIIGDNVSIGENTIVLNGTIIGNDVKIGNNCVIGSEGFQIVFNKRVKPTRIAHIGTARICDGVCIGDCCCICKSLFDDETYVGKNVMIDNFVQIAHNCFIGDNSVLTAGVVLCGTVTIKNNVWIGPNSSILNKVIIGEHAKIGLGSVVTRNIPNNCLAYGVPAKEKGEIYD